MVRSKLRRFGSLALILVLLSALIVPTFVLSPAAITQTDFVQYCKYGVFAGCSITSFRVKYIDALCVGQSLNLIPSVPSLDRGALYFNSDWDNVCLDVERDKGLPVSVDIDISFSVPFSFDQGVALFVVNGLMDNVEFYCAFSTTDGSSIPGYLSSSSSVGVSRSIIPKFSSTQESQKMIDGLSIGFSFYNDGALIDDSLAVCNTLFDRFCIYSSLNSFSDYNVGFDLGYDTGYGDGYNVGYDEAAELVRELYRDEYDRGYRNGYNEGATSSQTAAKDEGYRIGLSEGYDDGFLEGKLEGISEGDYNLSFASLFFSLFDAPVKVLSGLLDFDFLGLNMLKFACSVVTLILFVWCLKVLFL